MSALMKNGSVSAEAGQAAAGRRFQELLAEWKAKRPDDGGPYLLEIYRDPDRTTRPERVLALAERFPDDPVVLQHATRILAERGELARVVEALESFVESHPNEPRGYALLAAHYEANGNRPAALEAAEAWLENFPNDAAALSIWVRTGGADVSGDEIERRLTEALPRLVQARPDAELFQLCRTLAERKESALAASANDCIGTIAERGETPELRKQAALEILSKSATGGDWEGTLAALESLPVDERLAATSTIVARLRLPADCGRAVELYAPLVGSKSEQRDVASEIASGLHRCDSHFAARQLYVRLFEVAPAPSLPQVALRWRVRVSGRLVQNIPVAEVLAVLRRRWAASPGDPHLAEALDLVLEAGGMQAERVALLRSEGAEGRWPHNTRRLVELAESEAMRGDAAAAVDLLRGAVERSPGDSRPFGALVELLLVLDRDAEAGSVAERGLKSEVAPIRATSELTLARLAVRSGDFDAAVARYEGALAAGTAVDREVAGELFYVLAESGGANRIAGLAEHLCARDGLRESGQSVDACAAAALARSGERPMSIRYFERALDRAPQKPDLLGEMASALAEDGEGGRAERLLRERIALDPKDEAGWAELGMSISREADVAAHLRITYEAERAIGRPAMTLRTQHARLQLATGDARGAAATLLEMLRLRPELGYLDTYLREAYRKVGEEP